MKYPKEIAIAIALILCVLSAYCGQFWESCETVQEEVLRLHILANSDSEEDQKLKLKVRDRLLAESECWFSDTEEKSTAEENLQAHLAEIAAIAEEEIRENGYAYPVTVRLCRSDFSTREYEGFTMPAGEYDALRILIGEGEGQNWWCVMFPPLCLPTVLTEESASWFAEHGLTVLEQSSAYEPRFALVEWAEKLLG